MNCLNKIFFIGLLVASTSTFAATVSPPQANCGGNLTGCQFLSLYSNRAYQIQCFSSTGVASAEFTVNVDGPATIKTDSGTNVKTITLYPANPTYIYVTSSILGKTFDCNTFPQGPGATVIFTAKPGATPNVTAHCEWKNTNTQTFCSD